MIDMKRKFTLCVVILVACSVMPLFASEGGTGESPADGIEFRFGVRTLLLADGGQLDPYLELRGEFPGNSAFLGYGALTAGAYYRLHPNLKIGGFYRLQIGGRHDEDWILNADDHWVWADSSARAEHLLIADLSPRFLLDFLPGRDWVAMFKSRLVFNTYNGHLSLYTRPGLSYSHFRDRTVLFGFGIHYATGWSLNFGQSAQYSQQAYADGILHLSDVYKLQWQLSWNEHRYAGEFMARPFDFTERFIKAEFSAIVVPRLVR